MIKATYSLWTYLHPYGKFLAVVFSY